MQSSNQNKNKKGKMTHSHASLINVVSSEKCIVRCFFCCLDIIKHNGIAHCTPRVYGTYTHTHLLLLESQ